jgi:hypothetical protein
LNEEGRKFRKFRKFRKADGFESLPYFLIRGFSSRRVASPDEE